METGVGRANAEFIMPSYALRNSSRLMSAQFCGIRLGIHTLPVHCPPRDFQALRTGIQIQLHRRNGRIGFGHVVDHGLILPSPTASSVTRDIHSVMLTTAVPLCGETSMTRLSSLTSFEVIMCINAASETESKVDVLLHRSRKMRASYSSRMVAEMRAP
jgi:hypothetical protein